MKSSDPRFKSAVEWCAKQGYNITATSQILDCSVGKVNRAGVPPLDFGERRLPVAWTKLLDWKPRFEEELGALEMKFREFCLMFKEAPEWSLEAFEAKLGYTDRVHLPTWLAKARRAQGVRNKITARIFRESI